MPKVNLGTIEPIRRDEDGYVKEFDSGDKLAFIRGCIKKYKDKNLDKEIVNYISGLINK